MAARLRKCFWVAVPLLTGFLFLAPSSDNSSASTFNPLLTDVGGQDVPIGQLNSPLEIPSSAVETSFVDNDHNNDGQDDCIPDTVAIVFSALVLLATAGYSLLLNTCWLRRLGSIYLPTLERPG